MIPKRMQLSGFLSYLDAVEIDFTSFDLACISGANGAGKSSLLDAITWALFGQARKNNDAIINSKAKQAEVIFDFEYEQNLYRIQRIKPNGKTGQLDFFVHAGENGWRPLTEATSSQTQKRIQSTLRMDYDTFINASFFLQGKADQFAQQKPGDRKRILSTILGLEVWEQYREAASERRKLVESEVNSIRDRLDEVEAELAEEPERRRNLALYQENLAQASAACQAQQSIFESVQRLTATLDELRLSVARQEKKVKEKVGQLTLLEDRIMRRTGERDDLAGLVADEGRIRTAYATWQAARAEVERWNALSGQFHQVTGQRAIHQLAVETARTRLETDHSNLRTQQQGVQSMASQVAELEQKLAEYRDRDQQLTATLESRPILQAEINQLIQELSDLNAEKTALKPRMDEIKKRIDGLAEASGSLCPLCGQPLSPADRERMVEELNAEGKTYGDRFREINNTLLPATQQQRTKKRSRTEPVGPG
jgi:exonuclease SbcC